MDKYEEIVESWINGNISWVNDKIRKMNKKSMLKLIRSFLKYEYDMMEILAIIEKALEEQ